MTPEQFVYWLSGYIHAQEKNLNEDFLFEIKKAISHVKTDNTMKYAMYVGDNP